VPALAAAGTVIAAGGAFGRVFGFSTVPVPLIVSAVIGAIGGLAARLLLLGTTGTGPAAFGGGPQTAGADQGQPMEPGPAWLTDGPGTGPRPGLAGHGRRMAAAVTVIATTFLAAVATDAVSAHPGPGGLGGAFSKGVGGLVGGWSRILTTSVPVPPTADRLPVMAGVIALAVAVAVLAGSRHHPGVPALIPAGSVLLVALALGVHGPGSPIAVSAAPAIVAGLYLLVVSRPADTGVAWVPPARTAAAILTGTVVVVLALAVGTHWPLAATRAPVDLRASLIPPVDLGSTPNPVDLIPERAAHPDSVMFSAQVDRPWLNSPTNWRLVSLDHFDGSAWASDAHAVRTGTVLAMPPNVNASRLGPSTTDRLIVTGLTGPWVPTTGVPTGVQPADLGYDPATSTLVAPSSPRGHTFTVTSRLPAPSRQALDTAGVPVSAADAALTQVPSCFPAALSQLAVQATSRVGRPDQQAVAIEQALGGDRSGFSADPAATPGSSCGRLTQFVAARQGTAEQFATAYVLMARTVGLPARLAVGFLPGAVDPAAGHTVVHGSDATAWPEVDLAGVGWVALNPVPATSSKGSSGGAPAPSTTVSKNDAGLNQVRNTVANSPGSAAPNGARRPGRGSSRGAHPSGAWWWLAIPVVIVAPLIGLVGARSAARRRRRSRRRDPSLPSAERIIGAWAEVLDALAPFDPAVSALTPSEVTVEAGKVAGDAEAPVRSLGSLVDLSVYAGSGDERAAGVAWEMSDSAVLALRQAVPPGLRFRYLATGGPRGRDHPGGGGRRRTRRAGAPTG
jgi:transglutaminase-like putative cysteine protease